MMRKNIRARGVNVIATILMLITFFLVIGFSICAISTMNLNLSGRSVISVKSYQIAKAAVDQFIYTVNDMSDRLNRRVRLENLVVPPLNLDRYYDGKRNIFEYSPAYIGENISCDVHFKEIKEYMDKFYSTDNSSNNVPIKGARGTVPPYTIELIVNVSIGDFVRHYQVWLTRKWGYAIYTENAPVHIISNLNFDLYGTSPPTFLHSSCVNGNIYTRFNPYPNGNYYDYGYGYGRGRGYNYGSSNPPTYQEYAMVCPFPEDDSKKVIIANRVPPDPPNTYPASVFVGGNMKIQSGSNIPEQIGVCTGNALDGRIVYSYKQGSTYSSEPYIYYGNHPEKRKSSIFGVKIPTIFSKLYMVDPLSADHHISPDEYPDEVLEVNSYKGKYKREATDDHLQMSFNPISENQGQVDSFYNIYNDLEDEYSNPDNWEKVFFLKKSIDTNKTLQEENIYSGQFDWRNSKFAIKYKSGGPSYPLVDVVTQTYLSPVQVSTETDDEGNVTGTTISYTSVREIYGLGEPRTFTVDDSMIIAPKDIILENTEIVGDNCMIQVGDSVPETSDGKFYIKSGKVSAGTGIGTVIYCRDFLCMSSGFFNGVIITKDAMRLGVATGGTFMLKGAVLNKGLDLVPLDQWGSENELWGVLVIGAEINYDPEYMSVLNRFGNLQVVSWRELE